MIFSLLYALKACQLKPLSFKQFMFLIFDIPPINIENIVSFINNHLLTDVQTKSSFIMNIRCAIKNDYQTCIIMSYTRKPLSSHDFLGINDVPNHFLYV